MLNISRNLKQAIAIGAFVCATNLPVVAYAEDSSSELRVTLDHTKVHVLDRKISTVAMTNPAIADVTLHNDQVLLIVGRNFGVTNLIALDSAGHPIATRTIRVVDDDLDTVTMVRDGNIYSYSCSPRCERSPRPSDETKSAEEQIKLQSTRSKQASDIADGS